MRTQDLHRLGQVFQIGVEIVIKIRMNPVQRRVIQDRQDIFLAAGLDKFFDQIPAARCVHDIVIRQTAGIV